MTPRTAVLVLVALAAISAPARADVALSLEAGYFTLNAKDSAKAVFDGSGGGATFGGEVRYAFGSGFYVAGGGSYFKKDGERVFVAANGSPVFRLGHPLSVRIIPVYGTIGYRLRRSSSLVPYAGLGFGVALYREQSTVGGLTDSVSASKASGRAVAGVELGRGQVRIGAEVRYSRVPDAIGVGGVSKVYDEKDIGGLSLVGRIVLGPGH